MLAELPGCCHTHLHFLLTVPRISQRQWCTTNDFLSVSSRPTSHLCVCAPHSVTVYRCQLQPLGIIWLSIVGLFNRRCHNLLAGCFIVVVNVSVAAQGGGTCVSLSKRGYLSPLLTLCRRASLLQLMQIQGMSRDVRHSSVGGGCCNLHQSKQILCSDTNVWRN